MSRTGFTVLLVLGISVIWSQTGSALASEETHNQATSTEPAPTTEYVEISAQTDAPSTRTPQPPRTKRPLSPVEQEMADKARQHIADVVKKNLIRLFTVIAATGGPGNTRKRVAARQFGFGEDDDGDDEDLGFNPNTLPQVAQLLGAIFAGNLNLTSIVDRAFYLVPDTVRNQVQGVFSLLTGVTTTTARPAPALQHIPVVPVTPAVIHVPAPTTAEPATRATEQAADVVASFVISSPTRNKTKYKIRRKIPSTTYQPIVVGSEEYEIISDAELQRLEQNLVEKAKQYADAAPTVPVAAAAAAVPPENPVLQQQTQPQSSQHSQQQPTDFMGQLRQVFSNTNMTQVIRAMPDLFNGARQAFTLLETLGQLDDIPILSDLFGGDDYDDDE